MERVKKLTVSTDTEVNLLLEGVGLEGLGDTENGILKTSAAHQYHIPIGQLDGRRPSRCHRSDGMAQLNTYRRTLGHVGPGRGVSGTDDHGAHVRITGSSRTAGDTQSGEHFEMGGETREMGENQEERETGLRNNLGDKEKAGETNFGVTACLGTTA